MATYTYSSPVLTVTETGHLIAGLTVDIKFPSTGAAYNNTYIIQSIVESTPVTNLGSIYTVFTVNLSSASLPASGTCEVEINKTLPDIQNLSPSAIIELFELDLSTLGDRRYYFHSGTNGLEQDIVWQGITYYRFPIEADGFEKTTNGTIPRPTIRVANVEGYISELVRLYNDLTLCKITRRRTFAKYLDAINFPNSINENADPNVSFDDEIWIIDRKSLETSTYVEFELSTSFDILNVTLPARQCIQNICTWVYRDTGTCGYSGPPVANEFDLSPSGFVDKCGKRLSSCKLRFQNSNLPFGGFPSVGKIR